MNERIEQLALQSTDTIEVVNPDTGITHNREFFNKEKFAQLIVGECIKTLADNSEFRGCVIIVKHFGVEK
jgi:hypothetical protein